jgi:hypothetical protein
MHKCIMRQTVQNLHSRVGTAGTSRPWTRRTVFADLCRWVKYPVETNTSFRVHIRQIFTQKKNARQSNKQSTLSYLLSWPFPSPSHPCDSWYFTAVNARRFWPYGMELSFDQSTDPMHRALWLFSNGVGHNLKRPKTSALAHFELSVFSALAYQISSNQYTACKCFTNMMAAAISSVHGLLKAI